MPTRPSIAPAYAAAGAAAISVLVDERFGGTWDDLRSARAATTAPLLAKGFFSTEEHLQTAKEAGADAALLLLRDLDDTETAHLLAIAARLGLDTLVEAHDAGELDRAIALGAQVIGVNARDLSTFAIDRRAQLELVARAPSRPGRDRRVRHSDARAGRAGRARRGRRDPRRLGADARCRTRRRSSRELLSRPLVKVCGLTREEDVDAAADAGADLAGFILVPESPRAARDVLDVPDGMLSVAVWVGQAGGADADLDQVHTIEEGKVRGREAALLRDREPVARVLDLPWEGTDPEHWAHAAAAEGRIVLAGRLGPENVRAAIAAVRPWAVDAASSLESRPASRITTRYDDSWRQPDDDRNDSQNGQRTARGAGPERRPSNTAQTGGRLAGGAGLMGARRR